MAKYVRENFLVPVPEVKDLDALNQHQFECWHEAERYLKLAILMSFQVLQCNGSGSILLLVSEQINATKTVSAGST